MQSLFSRFIRVDARSQLSAENENLGYIMSLDWNLFHDHTGWSRPRDVSATPSRHAPWTCLLLLLLVALPVEATAQFDLEVAELGDCPLESGEVIRDCRVGYRTAGELNVDRSNAILFPSWYGGTSASLESFLGAGGYADSTEYFVIAVDAFGSGASSSPSNSTAQPGAAFPRYTIRDMVRAQRRVLQDVFGLDRLHALIGISMGGMQVFEWMTTYPDAAAKAVSIVGTPQMSSWDLMLWTHVIRVLERCRSEGCADASSRFGLVINLFTRTPQYHERETPPGEFDAMLREIDEADPSFEVDDRLSQTWTMRLHDVSEPFGGSMVEAARLVRAELLVVIATYDHLVAPDASRTFARLVDGEIYETASDCGHVSFNCRRSQISSVINDFLARPVRAAD